MGTTVENVKLNEKAVSLALVLLCTVFLSVSNVLKVGFFLQLMIYIFLLFCTRNVILEGFSSLCSLTPDLTSLVFVCMFSALLHGLVAMDSENLFAYAASVMFCLVFGEYITERILHKSVLERGQALFFSVMFVVLLLLFVATLIINLVFESGFSETLLRSFAVSVIFCPVALLIVPPIVSVLFTKTLQQSGTIVSAPLIFKRIAKNHEVIFDQRGVITEKEYSLYDIYSINGDKTELLSIAASIEKGFNHSIALAIFDAARKVDADIKTVDKVFEVEGRGVGAEISGNEYFFGNKKLFKEKKIELPEMVATADVGGYTPLYISKNGEFFGMFLLGNRKRNNVDSVIKEVSELGIRCTLLAEGERKDLRKMFDIVLTEREKVLHEFKNGDRIKAMVVSHKPIANADVTVSALPCKDTDLVIGENIAALVSVIKFSRMTYKIYTVTILVSVFLSLILTASIAFGVTISPVVAAFVTAAPAVCMLRMKSHMTLPDYSLENYSLEDDIMFGKINYTMKIEGMSCTHCSARVKTALESLRGVSAKISLEEKTASIKCPAKTTAEELSKAVADVGFTVVSIERV